MFDIQVGQQHFSLLSAYKPLSVKNEIFTKEMIVLLDLAILNRPDVIYIGDLNSDLLHPVDNGKQGRNLLDICDLYDLHNLINEPTKVSSTKESCLDAIDDIYWAWERLYNNVLDDHAPIKCKKSQGKLWWTKIHYTRDKKCHKCKCSVL